MGQAICVPVDVAIEAGQETRLLELKEFENYSSTNQTH